MPTFKVIQFRDAVICYEAMVEAASAQDALDIAMTSACAWTAYATNTLDSAEIAVFDANGGACLCTRDV